MFASPVLLLCSILATLWAAVFHLIFGRTLVDIVLYWFIALIGFHVGQGIGNIVGLNWVMVGQVHLIEGTLACWIAMLVAHWIKV